MINCFFVSDLHGRESRYLSLSAKIWKDRPAAVFMGGDLLPHGLHRTDFTGHFVKDFLADIFTDLRTGMGNAYPHVFIILGNDDARSEESHIRECGETGVWQYMTMSCSEFMDFKVFGYPFVNPTPFRMKDWEKYDLSRFVDPGCIPPTDGFRTVPPDYDPEWDTIQKDLQRLTQDEDLSRAVFLFHCPPYNTALDRAELDGQYIDHVPLDVHIGSIAIRRFIEERKPYLTLHGHVHESTRITGKWRDTVGSTPAFNAAHDQQELSIIRFDLQNPENAERILI
ncbi:MAG: metallophosphoesterase [Bacteroidales bacterium]|nr:metallophosphoesterase [Bacteroidales bacterium]